MSRRLGSCLALAICFLDIGSVLAKDKPPAGEKPASEMSAKELHDWPTTEVVYLLRDAERQKWGELKGDDERRAFIEDFWARRDPDPSTPQNEYRDEIAHRVTEANRLFHEGRAGWSTDRGRILITFGPPLDVTEDSAGTVLEKPRYTNDKPQPGSVGAILEENGPDGGQSSRSTTQGRITWTYGSLPGWELPANLKLVFENNSSGSYRLTTPVAINWEKYSGPLGAMPVTHMSGLPQPSKGKDVKESKEGKSSGGKAKDEEGAKRRELLMTALQSPATGGGIEAQPLFFPAAPGKVLVVVPLRFDPALTAGAQDLVLIAGVAPAAEDKLVHAAGMPLRREGKLPAAPSFEVGLDPGSYRLALALEDPSAPAARASLTVPLTVPSFDGGPLRLSSVVVARKVDVQSSGDVKLDQLIDGIAIGNISLDASAGNRVAKDSMPEAVFFLSGAKADPQTGALDVAASYRILGAGDKEVGKFPVQAVTGAVTSQPLPIQGFAPGDYRLEIKLEDRKGGSSVTDSVGFRIE